MLKGELSERRARYAQIHNRKEALMQASQISEQKRRISRIAIGVAGGTWHMGPLDRPLAQLTMQHLVHVQTFDLNCGVPVVYDFKVHSFVLET